ncbi:type I 3-dehydroquinate dehydratase [Methanolapillus ohkumae]|uniref:3-dehydroquinate dehydratase n=1 Tax=Methanolapillus ohkumae TaxID=3028298 RepID=A0AA96V9E0_9EURY|nr:3-dehydroquinate dehydratase [Methanosarcinaceae archaeon Am2]
MSSSDLVYPSVVGTIVRDPVYSAFVGRELGADILEIRFDLILADLMKNGDEKAAKKEILSLIRKVKETGLFIIGTFRSKKEGGAMDLNACDLFKWIRFVTPYVDFIDLEWSSSENKLKKAIEHAQKSCTRVIISSHYFGKMPSQKEMVKMLSVSQKFGACVSKIAVTPKDNTDVLKLFEAGARSQKEILKSKSGPANLCLIAMGEPFQYSRIIAPLFGSVFSYGFITEPAAPGQLRVDEIKAGMKSLNLSSSLLEKEKTC